jgi:hypothetical protein
MRSPKRRDENEIVLAICLIGMAIVLISVIVESLQWQ